MSSLISAWLRCISPENTWKRKLRDRTGGLDIESSEKSSVRRHPMVGQLELLTNGLNDRVWREGGEAVEQVMEPFERTQGGEADFYVGRKKPGA